MLSKPSFSVTYVTRWYGSSFAAGANVKSSVIRLGSLYDAVYAVR